MFSKQQFLKQSVLLLFALFAVSTAGDALAQSLDVGTPAPIRSTNLIGKIAPRDLGDSRLTDHYYAFTGTPGDLLITIQSRNLNGDLDVFTAGTLRPLLKLTLYAENASPVTKGIYLRKREDLILRIEARSPNDDDGTYQLFFGGSFEPIIGGPDIAENETPSTGATGDPKTRRVSSVGARLPEPERSAAEVAAAPTPTPEPSPEVPEKLEEPKPVTPKPGPKSRTTAPANTARNRRPPTRRGTTTTSPKLKPEETATTEESKTEEAVTEEPKTKATTARSTSKRGTTATSRSKPKPETPAEPASEPEPEVGPRLVIETNDGTLINRSMSSVRRVIVENGQVVVTAKDGKIERIPLANVVRMSIAP